MPTLQQLFRRKPVPEMSEETGADTGRSKAGPHDGLFQLSMFGVGATIGTGIFFVLSVAVPFAEARGDRVVRDRRCGRRAHRDLLCRAGQRRTGVGVVMPYAYATLGELTAVGVAACLLLEYGVSTRPSPSAGRST